MRLLSALALALAGLPTVLSAAPTPVFAVTGEIAGPDGGWDYLTFDPVHRRLYVSRSNGIMVIDVDSGKVTPQLVVAQRTHIAVPVNGGDELVVRKSVV